MGTRAMYLGAAGVVIDGRFRDITEMQEMGLPVSQHSPVSFPTTQLTSNQLFARGTSILGSNTFTRASELDVPLQFQGDLWIHPGDLIVGDQDGVVVVPPSLVDKVVEICRERKDIDDRMMKALKEGSAMGEAMAKFRK